MRREPGALATALVLTIALASAGSACGGSDDPNQSPPPEPTSEAATMDGDPSLHGVSDDRILFGQSAAFSGPARELGLNMRLGIEAAFAEVNGRGGVQGRRLELTYLDDAYEPEAAITNTIQLIEGERVFALIGAVGTPTSRSATPVAAVSQ